MDLNWTFLGDYLSKSATSSLLSPLRGVRLVASGWVRRASPEAAATHSPFIVDAALTETPMSLFCTADESSFIAEALSFGLRPWVSGAYLRTGHDDVIQFQNCSVWQLGGTDDPIPRCIVRSIFDSSLRATIAMTVASYVHSEVSGAVGTVGTTGAIGPSHLHPHTYASVSAYDAAYRRLPVEATAASSWTGALQAILQASSREACIRTGMALSGAAAHSCPLGGSAVRYSRDGGEARPRADKRRGSHERDGGGGGAVLQQRGYLVFAEKATEALCVAAVIAGCDGDLEWQSSGRSSRQGGTLIVAPRHAIFTTYEVFRSTCPDVSICHSLEDLRSSDTGSPRIVPNDLLRRSTDSGPSFADTSFNRAIYVDWPSCIQGLPAEKLPNAEVNVGILLKEDLLQIGSDTTTFASHIGNLLQVKGFGKLFAPTVQAMLSTCIVGVRGVGQDATRREVIKYDVLYAPEATAREEAQTKAVARERSRQMRSLYGTIMPPRGTGSVDQSTDAELFFRRSVQTYRPTPYAQGAFARPASECPVCFCSDPDCIAACGHYMCQRCAEEILSRGGAEAAVCPLCKSTPLSRRTLVRVASLSARADVGEEGLLRFLGEILNDGKKKVVLAGFGEIHHKIACRLRHAGVPILAWSGNAKYCLKTIEEFEKKGAKLTLLVDGTKMDSRWVSLTEIERLIIVHPLDTRRKETCCQVRDIIRSIAKHAAFDVKVISRTKEERGRALLPREPMCRHGAREQLQCPFFTTTTATATT